MHAFTVQSSDLGRSPDNPAGRWDVPFHALRLSACRFANGIAARPGDYDQRHILALARGDRQRAVIASALKTAGSRQEVYAVLLESMNLKEPSPALAAGLMHMARRIAHDNALRLTREALDLLKRARTLKA